MKKAKITFWITTTIIFLFEGVMTALTSQTDMAVQGITHLGYPVYFGTMLAVFKVLGALSLIIPSVSPRIKEWAYAGFGIDFISALVSIAVVDGIWTANGFNVMLILPIVFIIILVLSYNSYHKMKSN